LTENVKFKLKKEKLKPNGKIFLEAENGSDTKIKPIFLGQNQTEPQYNGINIYFEVINQIFRERSLGLLIVTYL